MTEIVGRIAPTPSNPFGVAPGQFWESTDARRTGELRGCEEAIYVDSIHPRLGIAEVSTVFHPSIDLDPDVFWWRPREIKLDRFTPKHHYRLIERKD